MSDDADWDTIEAAIADWVLFGSQLGVGHVIWDYQHGVRPACPFIEMSLSEIEQQNSEDWLVYDDAPDPAPGAELRVRVRGYRSLQLTLQCYEEPTHQRPGWKTLSRTITSLALKYPDLDFAGVGIGDIGAVQSISGAKGGTLEPRARCRVQVYVGAELESRETYIQTVQMRVHSTPPGGVINLTVTS